MALRMTATITAYGKNLTFSNAYIKVVNITGDKEKLVAFVDYYSDKDGNMFKRSDYIIEHKMNDQNAIAQVYEHIKTLPEFAGAIDC